MFDRMSVLMGAGVITAGMSAAMLAGAGVAIAATDPGADGQASTADSSGPSTQPTDADSDTDTREAHQEAEADLAVAETDLAVAEADADIDPEIADIDADHVAQTDPTVGGDPGSLEAVTESPGEAEPAAEPEAASEQPTTVDVDSGSDTALAEPEQVRTEPEAPTEPTPAVERLTMLSAANAPSAEATSPRQTVLSLVGAIVFNLYSFAIRVVTGPPLLPWGSTVTVHSSRLEIDCGDGYEVPADWYVPQGPTPTRLIYLQHGFMAAGPFYSYTAARLAEATHSIVLATSLTSNLLACDGCWVGGSPMHKAVADLFIDGNTALADSAAAAGYDPRLLDGVEKVVLSGHSAGGGLAASAAGYMADNGTIDRLAGVLMLDGVGFGPVMTEALSKLPDDLPIYNIAGMAYFWNMNGSSGAALENARPGQFNGVRLLGGLHSDPMAGGNPLIQIGLNLVTGFSWPVNLKAPEILSAAWINDMFAGTPPSPSSPFYGPPQSILHIDTPYGTAKAYVQPGPAERLSPLDVAFQFFADIVFGIDFATCAVQSAGSAAQRAGDLMELSTGNTALSLDGRTKPGQAIGQHVCTG